MEYEKPVKDGITVPPERKLRMDLYPFAIDDAADTLDEQSRELWTHQEFSLDYVGVVTYSLPQRVVIIAEQHVSQSDHKEFGIAALLISDLKYYGHGAAFLAALANVYHDRFSEPLAIRLHTAASWQVILAFRDAYDFEMRFYRRQVPTDQLNIAEITQYDSYVEIIS